MDEKKSFVPFSIMASRSNSLKQDTSKTFIQQGFRYCYLVAFGLRPNPHAER